MAAGEYLLMPGRAGPLVQVSRPCNNDDTRCLHPFYVDRFGAARIVAIVWKG